MKKINVYKGFSPTFLNELEISPCISNSLVDKFNYKKYDDEYKEKFIKNVADNFQECWITYEEFEFMYEYLEIMAKMGMVELIIYRNNIFPEIYPLYFSLNESDLERIFNEKETITKEERNYEKFYDIYNDIFDVNGKYYISYSNRECENPYIKEIINFYDTSRFEISENEEAEYNVDISDDLTRFIYHYNNILENRYNKISYSLNCNTQNANRCLEALKAFLVSKKINILFKKNEERKEIQKLRNELKNVGNKMFKIDNFEFRTLEFYKNPLLSNELEKTDQGEIMQYIVEEAEKAYAGKKYRDIFMTAPTGAGKSLIFQIPSMYLTEKYNKLIIIIEPLKGLMSDQQENLDKCGYKKARYLNSDIATLTEREKIVEEVKNGEVDILYISPETLIAHSLESLIGNREIGLVIIDEAHIVTTWGVGFRPDYWYLGSYINKLRAKKDKKGREKTKYDFPIFACTATAVNGGRDDTVSETFISLYMRDPIIKIGCAKRENIIFKVNKYQDDMAYDEYTKQKNKILCDRIKEWDELQEKTIIYCPYSSIAHKMRNGDNEFFNLKNFKNKMGVYTGGNYDRFEKSEFMNNFKESKINLMVATKAFGMGIDIPDISNVYHYAVTGGLSDYIQEIGRAARKKDMSGYAIVDYFKGDMKYMNSLFGMSQIRQFQVKQCLNIIYNTYLNKKSRNFLVNPKMFSSLFGKYCEEGEIENKLKIILLMIEKDFYEKNGVYALISRPSSIFTKAYVSINKDSEEEIINGKYGKYFKKTSKARDKSIQIKNNYNIKNYSNVYVSDIGDIFELDLKGIWEEYYSDLSFACFKYKYFKKDLEILPEIRSEIHERVKIKLNCKKGNLKELYLKANEEIAFISEKLAEFERSFFTKKEFKEKLLQRYNNSMADVISNSYFDVVDFNNRCVKYKRDADFNEKYQMSNSLIRNLAEAVINQSTLMKRISTSDSNEIEYFDIEKNTGNLELKLLSLLGLIDFEITGGNSPEIFIRLNAPDKIKNIVEDKVVYRNKYVDEAQTRHYRSVKILDYFFNKLESNKDRWDFVERYFLGEDLESYINSISEEKIINRNIEKYLDFDSGIKLGGKYTSWNELSANVLEEKYKYFVSRLNSKNIKIADYFNSNICIEKYEINTLFIYINEKIIISKENISFNEEKICKESGWKVLKVDELEECIEYLKNNLL